MRKPARPSQSLWQRTPKFLVGAVLGTIIGITALMTDKAVAVYLLALLAVVAGYVFFLKQQRNAAGAWQPRPFSPAPVLGSLVIGVMSIAGLQFLGVSLAWHPQGTIKKSVQNVTANGPVVDANTATTAVFAKPGDILNYIIVVSNVAPSARNQYNDMAYTVMTDTLPAGVELVSNPTKRNIVENIGTILPGKSVAKMYQVRVISTTSGSLIENKACFKADSVVKDNPQSGCDLALTKIKIPVTTPTPTPPTQTPPTPPTTPTPPTPPTTPNPPANPPTPPANPPTPPATPPNTPVTVTPPPPATTTQIPLPTQLPNVGAGSTIIVALFAVVSGYLFSALYEFTNGKKARR